MTAFATLLRTYRERAGISQSQLARWAGVDHAHISRMESGTRGASRKMVATLAAALGLTGDDETALISAAFGIATPEPLDPVALRADGALRALREAGKGRAVVVLEHAITAACERAERMAVVV